VPVEGLNRCVCISILNSASSHTSFVIRPVHFISCFSISTVSAWSQHLTPAYRVRCCTSLTYVDCHAWSLVICCAENNRQIMHFCFVANVARRNETVHNSSVMTFNHMSVKTVIIMILMITMVVIRAFTEAEIFQLNSRCFYKSADLIILSFIIVQMWFLI